MPFTEVFYTFVISSGIGFILAIGNLFFKSKCKEVNLFCLKCVRDVETEEKQMEFEYTHQNVNSVAH